MNRSQTVTRLACLSLLSSLLLAAAATSSANACGWGLCRHCRDAAYQTKPPSGGNGQGNNGPAKPGDNPDLFGNAGPGAKKKEAAKEEKSSDGSGAPGAAEAKPDAELSAVVAAIAPTVIQEVLRRVRERGGPAAALVPAAVAAIDPAIDARLDALEERVKKLEQATAPPSPPVTLSPEQRQIVDLATRLNAKIQAAEQAAREEFVKKLEEALK